MQSIGTVSSDEVYRQKGTSVCYTGMIPMITQMMTVITLIR